MRRCLAALALVAACSTKEPEKVDTSTAPAAVAAAPANTKADEDSIHALSQRWLQAAASHDTAAIGALFAEDGLTYPPMQPAARGPAAASAS